MANSAADIEEIVKNLLGAGLISPEAAGGSIGLETLKSAADQALGNTNLDIASTERSIAKNAERRGIIAERVPRSVSDNFKSRGISGGLVDREKSQQTALALSPYDQFAADAADQKTKQLQIQSTQTNKVSSIAKLQELFKRLGNLSTTPAAPAPTGIAASPFASYTSPFAVGLTGATGHYGENQLAYATPSANGYTLSSIDAMNPYAQQLIHARPSGRELPTLNTVYAGQGNVVQSLQDLQNFLIKGNTSASDNILKYFA